jgi:CRISPR/Cas system-associated exonuclease Cas4 (RecB family)
MNLKRKNKKLWLSHSGLDILYRCPKCFWLQYRSGIRQPEGISSRLPVRFDKLMKDYFNLFREKNDLPPFVKKIFKGKLQDPFQETYFYNINEKYGFYGKLDECFVTPENKHVVVDFKTASSDPKKREEVFLAYRNQLNEYAFLLSEKGKPVADYGYLIYFYPQEIKKLEQGLPLKIYFQKIKVEPAKVLPRLTEAIKILEGPMPKFSKECPFCQWREKVNDL